MATIQKYQLGTDGICSTCKVVPPEAETVTCCVCHLNFHAVCASCPAEEKWATKTMIQMFNATSTKRNFTFHCDHCLTDMETNRADGEGQRIRKMEENMLAITNELKEIKKLVVPKNEVAANAKPQNIQRANNMWFNPERLATVKAKPSESVLVINKANNPDVDKTNAIVVENSVIESKIPVSKSYNDKSGNLVVVCDSAESRDRLKTQVSAVNKNIEMKAPSERCPAVSIVGLSKSYEHHKIVEMMTQQNHFLRQFAAGNNIEDHIKIFAVKPIRGNQDVFQAFARISSVLRLGFKTFNDKVTIGLSTCKVYDQHHIKRCNNCQGLGHYYKDCPTPEVTVCANCGQNHSTRDCDVFADKCVNCTNTELPPEECLHKASDQNCPSLRKAQEKMKRNLNMRR